MDKELQQQIAEVLRQAMAAAQKGGQWIAGQVPDVLQQLIVWTIVRGVFAALLFALVLFVWHRAVTRWASQERDYAGDWAVSKFFAFMVGAFAALFSGGFTLAVVTDALKAAFAPKLFLLEYAAQLLK